MVDVPRHKTRNKEWTVFGRENPDGSLTLTDGDQVTKALLMDIRDELRALNRVMQCRNVREGFIALQRIDRRLKKKCPLK